MDDFNIHNWKKKYLNEQAGNYNYLVREENYGGRGSDVASAYQATIQLSAEDMQEFLEVLGSYFYDNHEDMDNFNAKEVAYSLDKASNIISQRTGN